MPFPRMTRRGLLSTAATPLLSAFAGGPKRVAALISEYRPGSHADAIVGKVLNGYYWNGEPRPSRLKLATMYTDQVPDEDMSRDLAAKHGFRIVPSIREALTLVSNTSIGARQLAVDGIFLICEHGAYPYNALGQKLYPRYEFFKQVIDVFRETGQVCPVFIDKHFSYDWDKAKWMYDQTKALNVPLMAGSVEPISRAANIQLDPTLPLERVVTTWSADFFDSKDSYGFHALESMQSLIERRPGGETGIAAVQCFERNAVWDWVAATDWSAHLLATAAATNIDSLKAKAEDPIAFVLEYISGLQVAVFRLNGSIKGRALAAQVKGGSDPVVLPSYWTPSDAVRVPQELRRRYPYNHFAATVHHFEDLVLNHRDAHPVERTLLTSGALAALHLSSYQPAAMYGKSLQHGRHLNKGRRIETPHLKIAYTFRPPADYGPVSWVPKFDDQLAAKGWKLGTFDSKLAGTKAGYFYYLPPGYEKGKSRYPVVYWLHGFGGGPAGATPVMERLDKAIRNGQAPPFILIACTDPIKVSQWTDSKDGKYPIESVIVKELIPHVDSRFRTIAKREMRGIEGYSMGGYGAAYIGFRNLDQFGSISALAGGMLTAERMCTVRDGVIFEKVYNHDRQYAEDHSIWTVTRTAAPGLNKWKPLLRVHVGTDDVSRKQSEDFHLLLAELQVPHEFGMSPKAPHNTAVTFDNWVGNPFDFWRRAFPAASKK
ncbi:MAG: hypothetical protein IT168_14620 [Bryobacterales bacterium]|nr:hypothetical protein [Bryobacterales bacterium]